VRLTGAAPARQRGQALVEFAFALPLFALFVFVTIQLSLLFVAYYSETRMARETARWLAINKDATDLQVAQHVQNTILPGLNGGTPVLCSPATCNWTTDPVYDVGKMRVQLSPCGAGSAPCTSSTRVPGQSLYVQLTYDVKNLLFLPTTFGMGKLVVQIPTGLPGYRVWVMVE
jgi:Flp pilus assembly protein TadG